MGGDRVVGGYLDIVARDFLQKNPLWASWLRQQPAKRFCYIRGRVWKCCLHWRKRDKGFQTNWTLELAEILHEATGPKYKIACKN